MKKTLKKGDRQVLLGAQERSVLVYTINDYLDRNKKTKETNHIIKRSCSYLEKIMGKLLLKKRCGHCGNWI